MFTKIIGVDIETTGLYPFEGYIWSEKRQEWLIKKPKIFCVAVNYGKQIKLYEDPEELRDLLEDDTVKKIIHNAAFDSFWFKRLHNITVRNIGDTKLREQIILGQTLGRDERNENIKKLISSSLLYTLPRYGLPVLENKSMGAEFANRDPDKPLTRLEKAYSKNDVRYLLELYRLQQIKIEELDLTRVDELESKVVERIVLMRDRGINFSKEIWLHIAAEQQEKFDSILAELPKQVKNWNSPKQVKDFFAGRGIEGFESYDQLEELGRKYKKDLVLQKFIELRSYYKNVTTYGASWLEDSIKGSTVDEDGRIRTDYEQIVDTGRVSSAHPNLQNIPKRGVHRAAFIPSPGYVFVKGDFETQEAGIAAAASKEEAWIEYILNGKDIHARTAAGIFVDLWNKGKLKSCKYPYRCDCPGHKPLREIAKVTNFAILYGTTAFGLSQQLQMNPVEATRVLTRFSLVNPSLYRWLQQNAEYTKKTRISYSADTYKRRRFIRWEPDWRLENIGMNNPVQGCGANMLKRSLINLPEDAPAVLQVHDELVLDVPNNKRSIAKAIKMLKKAMEEAADYCTGIPGLVKVQPEVVTNLLKK